MIETGREEVGLDRRTKLDLETGDYYKVGERNQRSLNLHPEYRKENRIYPEGVWARDSSEIKCCLQEGSHKLSPQCCSTLRFDNSVMHSTLQSGVTVL